MAIPPLSIIKSGHRYYLSIPASIDIEKVRIDRKLVKKYGNSLPIPSTWDDAKIVKKKDGEYEIKRKRHWKTVFLDGSVIDYPNVIIAISVPEYASIGVDNPTKTIHINMPRKHKITVMVLGDVLKPIPIRERILITHIN